MAIKARGEARPCRGEEIGEVDSTPVADTTKDNIPNKVILLRKGTMRGRVMNMTTRIMPGINQATKAADRSKRPRVVSVDDSLLSKQATIPRNRSTSTSLFQS